MKNGIQVLRPFASPPPETENLIPSLVERGSEPTTTTTKFPIFEQDVSPLVQRTTSPSIIIATEPETPVHLPQPIIIPTKPDAPVPPPPQPDLEIINPLDRPSSPDPELHQNPFLDPPQTESHVNDDEDLSSIPLSRTSSRTASVREDDMNSMSDWTEAFDNHSESSGGDDHSDFDSDSDVVSDAESEASWARVRTSSNSRGMGVN